MVGEGLDVLLSHLCQRYLHVQKTCLALVVSDNALVNKKIRMKVMLSVSRPENLRTGSYVSICLNFLERLAKLRFACTVETDGIAQQQQIS